MVNSISDGFAMMVIAVGVFCILMGIAEYLEHRKKKQEEELTKLWNEISSRNFDIEN